VLRAGLVPVLNAALISVLVCVGSARAQEADSPPGALSDVVLPGGVVAARLAISDPLPPDHSQFLLEIIRGALQIPTGPEGPRNGVLPPLLTHLDRSKSLASTTPETLPLPLPASVWVDAVFGGRATPETLAAEILRSRNAGLLYYGLLSLDDETRAWLVGHPDLVAELASRHAPAFVLAAPALRVTSAGVQVPGGERAQPAWEALAGRPVNQPADFVRALLTHDGGRLAYTYGALAQLTPAQIRLALMLDSPDAARRIETARRLHVVFARVAARWDIAMRPLWRPALDPALLLADLRMNDEGRLTLPGTGRFWSAVFTDDRIGDDPRMLVEGEPPAFVWLCEQIFEDDWSRQRTRYRQVLFASRALSPITAGTARDAVEAVRAVADFPALVGVIERVKPANPSVFARAARRAGHLSTIGDERASARAIAQFQGVLAVLTRAALRGALPRDRLDEQITSLSAVEVSDRGAYEGRLVRWLDTFLRDAAAPPSTGNGSIGVVEDVAAGPMERSLLGLLVGRAATEPPVVEWEGTRYRVDLVSAEATRLARLLGERPRPYISSALTLVSMADAFGKADTTRDARGKPEPGSRQPGASAGYDARAFEQVAQVVGWADDVTWWSSQTRERYRDVAAAIDRLKPHTGAADPARLASALRTLADELLARGLLELAYATALGQPDRVSITADDAASHHDFGFRVRGTRSKEGPWQFPVAGGETGRDWRATGSLLGLDVRLAPLSLVRLSSKPPPRRPTLGEDYRRAFVESVALVEPAILTESDRDAILSAMRKGRARLTAARTPSALVAIADEIRLSPARRSLLPWVFAHEPERLASFLSPSELLWLGLEGTPVDARLHAWGAPGEARLGCLCLQLLDRRPWETLAGRWGTGTFASGFPDLNLRLAELLAELKMPASLLGPVLASATLDFVNSVTSRDQDDRRALVEFVQALTTERVEQYLALLTTDGPLVPIAETVSTATKTGVSR
jgi:hypothetical protein